MKREGSFSAPYPSKKPGSAPIITIEANENKPPNLVTEKEKGKKEILASKKPVSAPIITLEADENKLPNLVAEIEKAKEEILASRTYHNLITLLETNPAIKSNIDRILGSHDRMPMVLYGIDSIRDSPTSKYRLALALLLKDHAVLRVEGIQVRHPNVRPTERDAMTTLGCTIVSIKEHCRKIRSESERPALYFMCSTRQVLLGDLLEENWRPSRLNRLAILGHRFAKISNDMVKEMSIKEGHLMVEDVSPETERLRYVCAAAWFTLEFDILDVSDKIHSLGSEADEHLEDLGCHFFQPAQIDMNTLLPRKCLSDCTPTPILNLQYILALQLLLVCSSSNIYFLFSSFC